MKCWLPLLLLCPVLVTAAEVQAHGLVFERWLCDTFFGGHKPAGYTQKWDIPAEANPAHGGIPVNPKAVKHGTPIGLGDALRQYDIAEPFLLIIGAWEQVDAKTKRWVNARAARVEPAQWRALWGGITRADLERLDAVVKDKSLTLEEARARAQAIKTRAPFGSAVIQLNPKIDRSQRRLQCSLRFDDFFTHLAPDAPRGKLERPEIFGVVLPGPFASGARSFLK